MVTLTAEDVAGEIAAAEREFEPRALRLWERMRVEPARWRQEQYPGLGGFWVVAVLGTRCMYFNEVEGGWGWGRYAEWNHIDGHHWQQDEILHVVMFTLFAIDHGGTG